MKLVLILPIVLLFSCQTIDEPKDDSIGTEVDKNFIADSEEIEENLPVAEIEINESDELKHAKDSIWNAAKVQSLNEEIIALSNGERHLTMLTTEVGDEFFIRLAEDNGLNYVTHISFYITPANNWAIAYNNVLDAVRVDFETWNLGK